MGFKFKLAPTVATAIVFPILMSLGFWQLDRAEQKQQKLNTYTERVNQSPIELGKNDNLTKSEINDVQYTNFKATGYYDAARSFLVDNKVHKSQVGFYVITPFILEQSESVLLVNRGWIKGNRYRSDLPEFATSTEKRTIKGVGYVPSKNFFVADNVKIDTQKFPAVIQTIDFTAIKEAINKKTYPFVLRLDAEDKTGFVREWQIVTSTPEKSESYAAQWFTMALVVVLIYLNACFNFKRNKTKES